MPDKFEFTVRADQFAEDEEELQDIVYTVEKCKGYQDTYKVTWKGYDTPQYYNKAALEYFLESGRWVMTEEYRKVA